MHFKPDSARISFCCACLFILLCLCAPDSGAAAASVRAKSAILYNLGSGKILYQLNPKRPVAPASLAKIMTMYLALDAVKAGQLSLKHKVRVSRNAARTGGSSMRLRPGEKVPLEGLLSGMAVASGNDAAVAVAEKVGGSVRRFTRQMNARAARLGMKGTKFKNPTGLPSAGQKTTAYDLLLLCRAYLRRHPEARRFHRTLHFRHRGRLMRNTNPLLGVMPGVDGLKTGWTVASGYNLIVTARRGRTRLLAIVLGATSKRERVELASRLVGAGFRHPANPALARRYIEGR